MGNRIFDILNKIVYNTLLALYQTFWAAIFLSFLFMFLYLYAKEHKWKKENIVYDIFSTWFSAFKLSQAFRKIFIFEYYGAAEPPVRCGESHLSGLTEPPHFVY